jgi:hypothetical protein
VRLAAVALGVIEHARSDAGRHGKRLIELVDLDLLIGDLHHRRAHTCSNLPHGGREIRAGCGLRGHRPDRCLGGVHQTDQAHLPPGVVAQPSTESSGYSDEDDRGSYMAPHVPPYYPEDRRSDWSASDGVEEARRADTPRTSARVTSSHSSSPAQLASTSVG